MLLTVLFDISSLYLSAYIFGIAKQILSEIVVTFMFIYIQTFVRGYRCKTAKNQRDISISKINEEVCSLYLDVSVPFILMFLNKVGRLLLIILFASVVISFISEIIKAPLFIKVISIYMISISNCIFWIQIVSVNVQHNWPLLFIDILALSFAVIIKKRALKAKQNT